MLRRPARTGCRRAAFLKRVPEGVRDGRSTVSGAGIPGDSRYIADRTMDVDRNRSVGVVHRLLGGARTSASNMPFITAAPPPTLQFHPLQDRRYGAAV